MLRFISAAILFLVTVYGQDRYSVYMLGIPVATVQMTAADTLVDGNNLRSITFRTYTTSLASAVFAVDNRYIHIVDPTDYRILFFGKQTTQPGVENRLQTEIKDDRTLYQNNDVEIPPDVFTIFTLLDYLRMHSPQSDMPFRIEREGLIYPGEAVVEHSNENMVRYRLEIELNSPQENNAVIENTDIFTWAVYKPGVTRTIEVDTLHRRILRCEFKSGIFTLTAELEDG